jgi:hypothetical protein
MTYADAKDLAAWLCANKALPTFLSYADTDELTMLPLFCIFEELVSSSLHEDAELTIPVWP